MARRRRAGRSVRILLRVEAIGQRRREERASGVAAGGGPARAGGALGALRKVLVAVVGGAVLAVGLALVVLPGPAFLVIPAGLAILATEFSWARRLLRYARERASRLLHGRRGVRTAPEG